MIFTIIVQQIAPFMAIATIFKQILIYYLPKINHFIATRAVAVANHNVIDIRSITIIIAL